MNQPTIDAGRFDIAQIAAGLPETATTLLVDHYLTNREAASARVFRVYKPTPPHYHATCDEYLYVFSGRGTFWMEDESTVAEFGPGELLFFKRGTVHAQPKILKDPVVFLSMTRHAATQMTSCLSIRRTALPKVSLGPISDHVQHRGHPQALDQRSKRPGRAILAVRNLRAVSSPHES